jgi:6-bladed beta-propeller
MNLQLKIVIFILCVLPIIISAAKPVKNDFKSIYEKGQVEFVAKNKIDPDSLPAGLGFKQLYDFTFARNNDIFASDNSLNKIFIFSNNGTFKRVFGQKGEGPGDLGWPSIIFRAGSEIVVWEQLTGRLSFFSEKGVFLRVVKPRTSLTIKKIAPTPEGFLVVERELDDKKIKHGNIFVLELYTKKLQFKKAIFRQSVNRTKTLIKPVRVRIALPFQPDVYWDTTSNGVIVFGAQHLPKINIYHPKNNQQFAFDHKSTAVKITDEDKNRVYSSYQMVSSKGRQRAPKELLDQIPFPDMRPGFGKILIDTEGNILVFPMKKALTEKYDFFDAYNPDGTFIKRVRITTSIKVPYKMHFDLSGNIWFLTYNESNDQVLLKYKFK